MNQLSTFEIDEIISYCDLKTKSRLNVIVQNIVLSTTVIDEQNLRIGQNVVASQKITEYYVFEHNGLTIFIETNQTKHKFRLDCEYGYERMIDRVWYVKDSFKWMCEPLYRYLNAILSILSNNPNDLKIDIHDDYIGLMFDCGKTMYGGNVHRYIGANLVKQRST